MSSNTKKNKEKLVKIEKVFCAGGEDGDGHPKVYLTIGEKEKSISCPYCGNIFTKSSYSL